MEMINSTMGDDMKKLLFIIIPFLMLSTNSFAANIQYKIHVDGIVCPLCIKTSSNVLKEISGVQKVVVNLEKGIIKICADEKVKFTDVQLRELFLEKGFTYKRMEKKDKCNL